MKIAIYGVSRSGKDYLIERIVNHLNKNNKKTAFHLKGSLTLNTLSNERYGCSFKILSEDLKNNLRNEFTKIVNEKEKEYDVIFVDGHYSFIEQDHYNVVFMPQDKYVYDSFFYLDTSSEMIVQFSRNSDSEKRNTKITETEVSNWKTFEKIKLENICNDLDKELIILDGDTNSCVNFIELFISNQNFSLRSPKRTARKLVDTINPNSISESKVLLLDCDKTISENDMTYQFCKCLDIDGQELKHIFKNDRYTSYQFFKVANLYAGKPLFQIKDAAKKAAAGLVLNKELSENINNLEGIFKIGITSGIFHVWQTVGDNSSLFDALFGSFHHNGEFMLVTPTVKKEVVNLLKNMGKTVYAVGDSIIDIPMLEEADFGFIVAHQKLNSAVKEYFKRSTKTKILQTENSNYKYDSVKIVREIA